MALIDSTAFKVQTAAMAAAMTAAMADDTDNGVAAEIRNPAHPLRQFEKFFNFDPVTGIVTSDDSYIDDCYAGFAPSKGNQLDIIADLPTPVAP